AAIAKSGKRDRYWPALPSPRIGRVRAEPTPRLAQRIIVVSGEHMQGKVTLEDHFAIDATLGDSQPFGPHVWPELRHRLLDFQDPRVRLMAAAGVQIMIASLNAPAIQGIADAKQAAEVARRANDVLAAEIAKRPDRFVGVAALPMQEPESATQELERFIKDLGFK